LDARSAGNGSTRGRRLCELDQRPWEPAFGAYSWSYDGVGNRTQEVMGSATNVYSLPVGSNRLTTVTQGATTLRSFLYDANGNILNDTRSGVLTAYTYNQNNRLKTVTNAGNLNATYTYNAQEQLAVRVLTNMTPSGTIHDVYDRDGNLLMESNGLSTGITREYIWLPGTQIAPTNTTTASLPRPIAVVDGVNTASPQTWWVHIDHLNRPVQMTDATKATVWQASWLPFGAPQAISGIAALDARFPGQWFEIGDGLSYNWNRNYDSSIGRYTQPDPLELVNGPSMYGYSLQSPLLRFDFMGREVWDSDPPAGDWSCVFAYLVYLSYCKDESRDTRCNDDDECHALAYKALQKQLCIRGQKRVTECFGDTVPHGTRTADSTKGIQRCEMKADKKKCFQCPTPP